MFSQFEKKLFFRFAFFFFFFNVVRKCFSLTTDFFGVLNLNRRSLARPRKAERRGGWWRRWGRCGLIIGGTTATCWRRCWPGTAWRSCRPGARPTTARPPRHRSPAPAPQRHRHRAGARAATRAASSRPDTAQRASAALHPPRLPCSERSLCHCSPRRLLGFTSVICTDCCYRALTSLEVQLLWDSTVIASYVV